MKRGSFFIIFLLIFGQFVSFGRNRNEILKVYNWADYIDEEVLNGFVSWYKEQTGDTVEIVYQTFDLNESMLTEIEIGHEDYDVICPSEYIIERMLKNKLLQPIRKDIIDKSIYYFDNVSPFVLEKFQEMSPKDAPVRVSDYTVGYMWGTTGWLYNKNYLTEQEVSSWGLLLDEKIRGKVLVKDAFRDVYSVYVLYAYYDAIKAGKASRDDLVENITPERISRVEDVLRRAKDNIAGWEVDFGKEEMTKGNMWLDLCWSGDAQWAIQEAREGRDNIPLAYTIPIEGSNVWFDGWCIPVYAKNTKAATYFIDYMCMPENAIKNMEETGYVSVIATPEILDYVQNSEDENKEYLNLTYFFGPQASNIFAHPVYYPDLRIIERCALMHDCAEQTEDMLKMWSRIKGDNLNMTMVLFIVVVVLFVGLVVIYRFMSRRKPKMGRNKK